MSTPLRSSIARLRAEAVQRAGLTALRQRQTDDRQHLDDLARAHDTTARVADHAAHIAEVSLLAADAAADEARLARSEASGRAQVLEALHDHAIRLDRIERTQRVLLTMRWLDHLPVDDETTVSVVLPTRNRAERLPGAIASVEAQTHRRWELVVVDDGSTDDTRAVLDGFDDDRIRVVAGPSRGLSAARNAALDHVTGDVVVYLDDDNRMDRLWCQAVAWAFAEHPDHDVAYGARLIDSMDRVLARAEATPFGDLPELHFEPFDRATLERGNIADIGVIAHRRSAPARFDESMPWLEDWDLLLSLTATADPLELPVVAVHYTSETSGRLSDARRADTEAHERTLARVRAKHLGPRADP